MSEESARLLTAGDYVYAAICTFGGWFCAWLVWPGVYGAFEPGTRGFLARFSFAALAAFGAYGWLWHVRDVLAFRRRHGRQTYFSAWHEDS